MKEISDSKYTYLCEAHPSKWEIQLPSWWNNDSDPLGFCGSEQRLSLGSWKCPLCKLENKVSNA
tara:strand:+ start:105 stop:296 length:192 start_codon:yes stop_codon:yes gene_type:complete